MRISDWSSDVCSSDLTSGEGVAQASGSVLSDYVVLLKPRVMSLVVFTGFAGMIVAPDEAHPLRAAAAVLCIALGAGAAAVINMWYERDLDALMARTRRRPIPAGRMAPAKALAFGIALSLASVIAMAMVARSEEHTSELQSLMR